MPNGLQSFQIAADTDVRTKGIDDSMLSYNPNTLSDIPVNKYERPVRPPTGNPFTQLDPFAPSMDPFAPVSFEEQLISSPTGGFKEQLATTVEGDFKEELLNPTTPQNSLIVAEAHGLMNDPRATDQEKETSFRDALSAMRLLEQYDVPTQLEIMDEMKRDLKDVAGIDVDAYANLNREGDPYMAASSVLIDANRAGYSTPQAISKALNAFNATRQAIKLPDARQVEMAFKLLDLSKEEKRVRQAAWQKGIERKPYVVEDPISGKREVMILSGNQLGVLNQRGVPYRDAYDTEVKGKSSMYLDGDEVVVRDLDQYEKSELLNKGVDVLDASVDYLETEFAYAGDDGVVHFGTGYDYLPASNTDNSIRIVKPGTYRTMIKNETNREVQVTNRALQLDDEKYEQAVLEGKKYTKKWSLPPDNPIGLTIERDLKGGTETISYGPGVGGSSPGLGAGSGVLAETEIGPDALKNGIVTAEGDTTKINNKAQQNVNDSIAEGVKAFEARKEGITRYARLSEELFDVLGHPSRVPPGSTAQRVIGKVVGGITVLGDIAKSFGLGNPTSVFERQFNNYVQGRGIIREEGIDEDGKPYNIEGTNIGNWGDYTLSANSTLWKDLKQAGLTDLTQARTLLYRLAMASLEAQNIPPSRWTDQKIQMELQTLGGNMATTDEMLAALDISIMDQLNSYDEEMANFYQATPPIDVPILTYHPAEGDIGPYSTSVPNMVNPWVYKGYAKEIEKDGVITYEGTGQLQPFDTSITREKLLKLQGIPGSTVGISDTGNPKVRAFEAPSIVRQFYETQPGKDMTVPNAVPGLTTFTDVATAFQQEYNERLKEYAVDYTDPNDYAKWAGVALQDITVDYINKYFGENALQEADPNYESLKAFLNFVRTYNR